jgi:hypothetical protein
MNDLYIKREIYLKLTEALYITEPAGGLLHILCDDGNYDDESLVFLRKNIDLLDKNSCIYHIYSAILSIFEGANVDDMDVIYCGCRLEY